MKRKFYFLFLIIVFFVSLYPITQYAGEPTKEPILRIESGMHTAFLRRIGSDAYNRFFVTFSDDKTVRVWDYSGRLLRTIRPPIDFGNEGKLYSGAISPDGKWIVCGGWTGYDWDDSHYIYIFNRETGQLHKRIINLPNVINHLSFSESGKFLGVSLGGGNGIRIYETENFTLYAQDTDYKATSLGNAFYKDELFAAVAYDGFIRIYALGNKKYSYSSEKMYSQLQKQPYSFISKQTEGVTLAFLKKETKEEEERRSFLGKRKREEEEKSRFFNNKEETKITQTDSFQLLSKIKAYSGTYAFSVAFSPDGRRIAVGYSDKNQADVYNIGYNGKITYAFTTNNQGLDSDDALLAVCFSADGRFLYTAGMYQKKINGEWLRIIRKYSNQGEGSYIEIPTTRDTIAHLLPLRNGGIAFGSADPAFGIIDASDRLILLKEAVIADFRDNQSGFLVSYDGSTVKFGFKVFGEEPAQFSIFKRSIQTTDFEPFLLKADVTSLNIKDWKNTREPKLNNKNLEMDSYEIARSLAIAPDKQSFILGADWNIRCFSANGTLKWKKSIPSAAWAVNISGNGKFAIASLGDGTIRWYRMTDGAEMLAFFPHKDKKRWVLWTPSGYYDASVGAEEFIGWHINNGKDRAADFYPISRFRAAYYRPDIIAKIIETTDEKLAIEESNTLSNRQTNTLALEKILPPIVTIISPQNGTEVSQKMIKVQYMVRSPSGEPITGIKVLVDGRPTSTQKGLSIIPKNKETGDIREVTVEIPEKDCEISIIAENKFTASDPAIISLIWKGKKQEEEFIIKPKLYILAIGVSNYNNPQLRLNLAAKDARDFASAFLKQKGDLYRDVVVKILTDKDATKDNILDGLDWIQKETTSKDVAMVFLSGHGVNDQAGVYYYLPVNADLDKLKKTGVPFTDIKNTVTAIAGKALFFIDTCHSGNIMGTRKAIVDVAGVVNELASAENGVVVFASSTGNQYSLEDVKWGNGAFTKALLEGISGKADYTGKGRITINMLDLYISERVKELTKGLQTPTTTKPQTIPDFPIALKK